jgi:hypothetical protein
VTLLQNAKKRLLFLDKVLDVAVQRLDEHRQAENWTLVFLSAETINRLSNQKREVEQLIEWSRK